MADHNRRHPPPGRDRAVWLCVDCDPPAQLGGAVAAGMHHRVFGHRHFTRDGECVPEYPARPPSDGAVFVQTTVGP